MSATLAAMVAWDDGNTLTAIGIGVSVALSIVLFMVERRQRKKDRTTASEERERERRDVLVDVRLVRQAGPPPMLWFRIALVGGTVHTWVYVLRVAWRQNDGDEWVEVITNDPPLVRLAVGQMQHVAPGKPMGGTGPFDVEVTWQIDNETHGRRQSVVTEPWT